MQSRILNSCYLCLSWSEPTLTYWHFQYSAGRFGEGNVFTEEDWAAEEGVNPYEKSKAKAEKAAWELVKNLQGVLVSSLIIIIIVNVLLWHLKFQAKKNLWESKLQTLCKIHITQNTGVCIPPVRCPHY